MDALELAPEAGTAGLPIAGFVMPNKPNPTSGTVAKRRSRPPFRMTTHRQVQRRTSGRHETSAIAEEKAAKSSAKAENTVRVEGFD
jgi:hypothetical protein